jgi:protoporphyrinogen oxidase
MKIAVIGGGLMGLALAEQLASPERSVQVFERDPQVGGLTTYQNYGPFYWDRFYHVILPSDRNLIAFLRRIGLAERLRWARTLTGFFIDRRFYSLSSGWEFLRFPPVGLLGKARLAFTILYCSRIENWRRLETIPVGNWLRKLCGKSTYEKMWRPLLLAKLGENYERVSAVFIWSYIKRMFSARDPSTQKEQLGHVTGGYKTVFDRLLEVITAKGGAVHTQAVVSAVRPAPEGGLYLEHGSGQQEHFDRVVFTGPVAVLRRLASPELVTVQGGQRDVEYLGVVCMVLLTRRPLVPYYIVNIADDRIPFTGIIGMSTLVEPEETAGLYMAFLPKYVHSDDALLKRGDEDVREWFLSGLRLMFPDLDAADIHSTHIHRASRVQPLQVLNYSELVPTVATQHPDFFVLNSAQFVANTLNNNEVIGAVDAFLNTYAEHFSATPASSVVTSTPPPTRIMESLNES